MIFGLGPFELVILGALVVAVFGMGSVPVIARKLGWLHGTIQRVKLQFPWVTRIPLLSRFFR